MKYNLQLLISIQCFSAHCFMPMRWLEIINKVFIETLPTNRVIVFSNEKYGKNYAFEVPKDLTNFEDTSVHCSLARTLGFSSRPFWNPRSTNRALSNVKGTKILTNSWEFRLCGLNMLPTEYPENYCNERGNLYPTDLIGLHYLENIYKSDRWSKSLLKIPLVDNPWVTIPHYEYRQCFRYSQSLFVAYLKIPNSDKRFMHATVKTYIPTEYAFTFHEFEYWATEYSSVDILRLINMMNSIQIYTNPNQFSSELNSAFLKTENLAIVKSYAYNPVDLAKRMFSTGY